MIKRAARRVSAGLRILTVALLMAAALVAVGTPAVSAQDEDSGLDGNTFTGPNFGWSVEWDEDVWEFDTEQDSRGTDYFALATVEEPFALAQFFGVEDFQGDPDDCVAGWEDAIADRDGVSDLDEDTRVDLPETPDDGAATAYTYVSEFDDGEELELIEYVACQTLVEDEAVLIFTILTTPNVFEDIIPIVDDLAAEIVLPDDGGSRDDEEDDVTPEADDEDEETPEADDDESGVDGNEYVGPNFGWALSWDEDVWSVDDENNSGGADFLNLVSEDPTAFVLIQGIEDYEGDPDACAEDWADVIEDRGPNEDIDEARNLDVPDEPRGATGIAYTYTAELDDGDTIDLVDYIQCYELVEGEAVLQVVLQVSEDDYEDALPLFEDLVAELDIA